MPKKNLFKIFILFIALIAVIIIGVILFMNGYFEKTKEIPTYIVGIDDLYCNIKDSKKMVKINMVIETSDDKLKVNMENKKFHIRDLTNKIIVSKTEEDLLGENGHANLKKEILKNLEEVFQSENISNIYFHDFIIQ